MKKINLPLIPTSECTPLVSTLLTIINQQQEIIIALETEVNTLKDEIKRLKKHTKRPKIKPSKMDKGNNQSNNPVDKRAGSDKTKKNAKLSIDKTERIRVQDVPEGAQFKGYQKFIVQELIIKTVNTEYQLERWLLVDGSYLVAELPSHVKNNHFGATLRSYVLYQYYHALVTQPLLLEQLRDWGIDISSGQLNRLLIENKTVFHEEKESVLSVGLSVSSYVNVDDTGARHKGKNGYCTYIGNEWFSYFFSTESKSRINFLELLSGNKKCYSIDSTAINYMQDHHLAKEVQAKLLSASTKSFHDKHDWENHLNSLTIIQANHRKLATEGALVAGLLSKGFNPELVIVSDDAGQFNVFLHGLCWIHAERKINELVPLNDTHAKAIDTARGSFWEMYADLKEYKLLPTQDKKERISKKFDELCNMKTNYELLNQVLKRLRKNKSELLLVLERPEIELHNNSAENNIREYVKRRKISGSTRNDDGRRCRDTFASLKKTCRKLKVGFWDYIQDRVFDSKNILPLPDMVRNIATAT